MGWPNEVLVGEAAKLIEPYPIKGEIEKKDHSRVHCRSHENGYIMMQGSARLYWKFFKGT